MKTQKCSRLKALAFLALVGFGACQASVPRNVENQIYRGWHDDEGRKVLIFDPKHKTERGGRTPDYSAFGNPLEEGQAYNLIVIPYGLLGEEEVLSATPVTPVTKR